MITVRAGPRKQPFCVYDRLEPDENNMSCSISSFHETRTNHCNRKKYSLVNIKQRDSNQISEIVTIIHSRR